MKSKFRIIITILIIISMCIILFPNTNTFAGSKKIKLNQKKITTGIGCTEELILKNTKGNITWSSSNVKVADVSKTGVVSAKTKGKVTITATYKNKKYTCTVNVKEGTTELNFVKIKGGYEVNGLGTCKETAIIIPQKYKSQPVIKIGNNAFSGKSDITSIKIPNSVKSIGDMAFYGCSSLSTIYIPDSVTSVGYGAFNGCTSLKKVTVSENVNTIEDSTFLNCKKLTNIYLPYDITSIGDSAFKGCSALENLRIPGDVTTIGASAFEDCISIKELFFSNKVISIGECAFWNCSSLNTVEFPESLISLGESAFFLCPNIKTVYVVRDSYADKYIFRNYPLIGIKYR